MTFESGKKGIDRGFCFTACIYESDTIITADVFEWTWYMF